jgi:hypothetical protein
MKQLELVRSRALRDTALRQVDRDWMWATKANLWILRLDGWKTFTSEDVLAAVGFPECDARALGPVIMRSARAGLIRKTGRYVQCSRPSRHAAPVAVWERVGK